MKQKPWVILLVGNPHQSVRRDEEDATENGASRQPIQTTQTAHSCTLTLGWQAVALEGYYDSEGRQSGTAREDVIREWFGLFAYVSVRICLSWKDEKSCGWGTARTVVGIDAHSRSTNAS